MTTLRLFSRSDPTRELENRVLTEGEISVGRDQDADWAIPDPSKTLSRRHCVIALHDGVITLRDDSTNGVFLGGGERLPAQTPTPIAPGAAVVMGAFLIHFDAPRAAAGPDGEATTAAGGLLDAFCSAARIDSSVLSGEEPAEVMRRLGAIYREMVIGLGALMSDRTQMKARYGLEWTTVQAAENNPFRWAPPQRVAIDLLQMSQGGFLSGETAVQSSFEDLKDHQLGLAAGSQAALETLLAMLAPEEIVQDAKGAAFLMKKKAESVWTEYVLKHAKASDDVRQGLEGSVGRAFREAYEAALID